MQCVLSLIISWEAARSLYTTKTPSSFIISIKRILENIVYFLNKNFVFGEQFLNLFITYKKYQIIYRFWIIWIILYLNDQK